MPDFRMPPEWAPQDWIWVGFPHAAEEWPDVLVPAQEEIAAFANAVVAAGDTVRLLVRDADNAARARDIVDDRVAIRSHVFGDVWLRDTGPLVVSDGTRRQGRLFGFNGWGGKYVMPGDTEIGAALAAEAGIGTTMAPFVLEGGSIDNDGAGVFVTTEQCLLNPNRNPGALKSDYERWLGDALGAERMLWLGEGLINDHTDGHVDNLARFVAPGVIAIPVASGSDDPNAAIYADARGRATGFGLEVVPIPSPGRIEIDGVVQPASHMNFAITSSAVIVPVYGTPYDDAAIHAIEALFPGRTVIGLGAHAVLAGGGSFHCASQQMPSLL